MNNDILLNFTEIIENNIIDAIEDNKEYIDFSVMTYDELKEECINLIKYYFDNEMIGLEINYNDIVIDMAKTYNMLKY